LNDGEEDKMPKKMVSKQLAPIAEAATADFKIIESRYIKDDHSLSICNKLMGMGKTRGRSVGRVRLADVFINF
jgi:hypothetical protein